MIVNNLVMVESSNNIIIDKYFNEKEAYLKNDYDVKYIKISNTKNLSSYVLIKHNIESISLSRSRKKSKSFYSEVVFAGLRQPTKDIKIGTYTVLKMFTDRFKISDMDICIDGLNEIDINSQNRNQLHYMFNEYIDNIKDTHIEKTSFYINSPSNPMKDTDYFKKILLYDKYIKENRHKKLDDSLKNWKRLELTLFVNSKFKGFILDDYIEDVQTIAKEYFNASSFSYEYLELQKKLLIDKRTHRGKISL